MVRRFPICLPVLAFAAAQTFAGPLGAIGDLYVVSDHGNAVYQFDGTTGAPVGLFATGGLNQTTGLVFGPAGDLYVANWNTAGPGGINRYDGNTGAFLGEFVPTTANGGLVGPGDITFGPNGNLFVPARWSGGVYEYDGTTGAFLRVIGSAQTVGAAFLGNGNLLLADLNSGQILEYAMPAGTALGVYATLPATPLTMTFAPNGNLFVLTPGAVYEVDAGGNMVNSFAVSGTPADLAFGPDALLYITDWSGWTVERYDPVSGAHLGTFASSIDTPWGLTFKVPEPATLALLLVGGLKLPRRRR